MKHFYMGLAAVTLLSASPLKAGMSVGHGVVDIGNIGTGVASGIAPLNGAASGVSPINSVSALQAADLTQLPTLSGTAFAAEDAQAIEAPALAPSLEDVPAMEPTAITNDALADYVAQEKLSERFDGMHAHPRASEPTTSAVKGSWSRRAVAGLRRSVAAASMAAASVPAFAAYGYYGEVAKTTLLGVPVNVAGWIIAGVGAVFVVAAFLQRKIMIALRTSRHRMENLVLGGVVGGLLAGTLGFGAAAVTMSSQFIGPVLLSAAAAAEAGVFIGSFLGYHADSRWVRALGRLSLGLAAGGFLGGLTSGMAVIGLDMTHLLTVSGPHLIAAGAVGLGVPVGISMLFGRSRLAVRIASVLLATGGIAFIGVIVGMLGGTIGMIGFGSMTAMGYGILAGGGVGALIGAVLGFLDRRGSWLSHLAAVGPGLSSDYALGMMTAMNYDIATGHGIDPIHMAMGGALGSALHNPIAGGIIADSMPTTSWTPSSTSPFDSSGN